MNLYDQIGALEAGIDQLIESNAATPDTSANDASSSPASTGTPQHASTATVPSNDGAPTASEPQSEAESKPDAPKPASALHIGRPSQNEITMTIGDQTVSLHPEQVGRLIEELANARASMQPEVPMQIPQGWRFVSTKDPVIAVQKQSNGDRLLVARHTGHGWVPLTFSPQSAIQLYMMLTKG